MLFAVAELLVPLTNVCVNLRQTSQRQAFCNAYKALKSVFGRGSPGTPLRCSRRCARPDHLVDRRLICSAPRTLFPFPIPTLAPPPQPCASGSFLANVNSCSCSLYVVVRPSVVCLSVTFVHPTQPIKIFGNVSAPRYTLVT